MARSAAGLLLALLLPPLLAQELFEKPGYYAAVLDPQPIGFTATSPRFSKDAQIPCWCSSSARGHPPLSDPDIVAYAAALRRLQETTSPLQRAPAKHRLERIQTGLVKRFSFEGYVNLDAALRAPGVLTGCMHDTASGRNIIPVRKVKGAWEFLTMRECDKIPANTASKEQVKLFTVASPPPKPANSVSNPRPDIIDIIPFPSPPPGVPPPPKKIEKPMPPSKPKESKPPMPSATPVNRAAGARARNGGSGLPDASAEPSAAVAPLANTPAAPREFAAPVAPTAEPAGPLTIAPSPLAGDPSASPSALPSADALPSASPSPANEGCVAVEHLSGAALQHARNLRRATLCAGGFCATPNHALIVDGAWTSMKKLCGDGGWKCSSEMRWVNNLKIARMTRLRYNERIVITPYDDRFPVAGPWVVQMVEDAAHLVFVSIAAAVVVLVAMVAVEAITTGAEAPACRVEADQASTTAPIVPNTSSRCAPALPRVRRSLAQPTVAATC